jgi:hypothetical protein
VCGIVCLLLITLWLRSYLDRDFSVIEISNVSWIHLVSMHGRLSCAVVNLPAAGSVDPFLMPVPGVDYHLLRQLFTEGNGSREIPKEFRQPLYTSLYFDWNVYGDGIEFVIPYWLPAMLAATLAAVPWITWKFRLRTLLIVMTLVAVLLTAIVYSAKYC